MDGATVQVVEEKKEREKKISIAGVHGCTLIAAAARGKRKNFVARTRTCNAEAVRVSEHHASVRPGLGESENQK